MCSPSYNKDPNAPGYSPGPSSIPTDKDKRTEWLNEERRKRKAEEAKFKSGGPFGPKGEGHPDFAKGITLDAWMAKVKEGMLVYSDTAGKRLA